MTRRRRAGSISAMSRRAVRPRVRFARPHYAPGLDWSAYRPLLRGWEMVVGDPSAPDALDGVDVLVAAAVDAGLIDAGGFGLIQQIGTGTDRIDVEAATAAGVWVSGLPSGLTGNADGVADTAVLLTLAGLRRLDESRRALADGRWGEPAGRTLAGRTVVVVGLGDVGERVVARLRGFGARLVGVRARPERGAPPASTASPGRPRSPPSRPRPTRSSSAPASRRVRCLCSMLACSERPDRASSSSTWRAAASSTKRRCSPRSTTGGSAPRASTSSRRSRPLPMIRSCITRAWWRCPTSRA
jgi:D-isomer specific 2-hydroxyacid dehydrogenase, NAD binding domain/D-isomer specific 2-hydroxyacid dehydrogenase, catalytic domain